jgi:vitamin B12 transporter
MDDANTLSGAAITDTTGRRQSARLRTTFALDAGTLADAAHTLTLALEAEKEGFRANDPDLVFDPSQLEERTRTNIAAVAEYRGELAPGLDLQIGLRHDANDRFADATTWSAGLSWRLPNGTTGLHASAGTGVQNPTLYEQFGFIPDQFQGNPDLRPEKSFGWDVGVEQTVLGGRGTIDVTYFQDRLTDEILTLFPPPDFIGTPVNDDGVSRRRGVEVEARVELTQALRLGLGYTYTDARDPDGRREVRRPMHQARLALDWALPGGRTDLGLTVEHAAGRRDIDFTAPSFGSGRIDLPDYTLVGLSARHRLSDRVELTARVTNLFDVRYEEVQGYAAEGLNAVVGVRTTW